MAGSLKMDEKFDQIGNANVPFTWDPGPTGLSETLTCEGLAELDGVVLSFGPHYMRFPVSNYTELQGVFDRFTHCQGPQPRMVYVTPPPEPPRMDEWAIKFTDQRTNSRIHRWRRYSVDRALAAGIWRIHEWSILSPFVFHPLPTDANHYHRTDGLEAVVDEVITRLGICGTTSVRAVEPVMAVTLPA